MAERRDIHVVAGVLRRDDAVLIAQRPADKHGEGLWEFPGGKIEASETPHAALVRELREELGIEVHASEAMMSLSHEYPARRVHLEFLSVVHWSGEPHGAEGQQIRWCPARTLQDVEFLAANAPLVAALVSG